MGRLEGWSARAVRDQRMTTEQRFWRHVRKTDGCWIWTGAKTGNYGFFLVNSRAEKNRCVGAHRFSWMLAHGDIPEGMLVCHHCDVRACVNPAHLFLGTYADNYHDAAQKGRASSGPRHGWKTSPERMRPPPPRWKQRSRAKLSEDQVRSIRQDGRQQTIIAQNYNVSRSTISAVKNRQNWRDLQ